MSTKSNTQRYKDDLNLHDLFTLMILPIGTLATDQIQYMKYIGEYIPKLQIHQHLLDDMKGLALKLRFLN